MPSALRSNPGIIGRMVNVLGGKLGSKDSGSSAMDRVSRLGLSQRQQSLVRLWAWYRGQQYQNRKLDWNGREALDELSSEIVSTQGYIPPGFADMSTQSASKFPLKFRRPTAPYALVKVIVDRFTGLLFSEQQHPEIKVEGDPVTEDWLRAVADSTRIWQCLIQARAYGGALGTAVLGFQFSNGKPVIEVHDPCWVQPTFVEHGSSMLRSIEKRYTFPKEIRDEATGRWETKQFWYRRVIDESSDVLFEPAEVGSGEEPDWKEARRVDHNFGFCPAVWVQNLPVQDTEDGDPDCTQAVYETVAAIDTLVSQANRALLANCDPQLVVTTKADMTDVRLSGDSALKIPEGDAKFLEVQATGPKAALELADQLRKQVLEMAQCILEHPDVAAKTATEVERMYQSMLAKADVLREQYGQKGIIPLLEMIYKAAYKLGQAQPIAQPQATVGPPEQALPGQPAPVVDPNDGILQPQVATMVRSVVVLPPRYEKDALGVMQRVERELGGGGTINLKWPGYFQPTLTDVGLAVTAAVGAMSGGLMDDETAIGFIAPYFKVEDKTDLVDKVRANAAQQSADMAAMMASANQPKPSDVTQPPGPIIPPSPV